MRRLTESYYYEYLDEEADLLVHISSLNALDFMTRLTALPRNEGRVWRLEVFECNCGKPPVKEGGCDDCPEHEHELPPETVPDVECDHVFRSGGSWVTCVHCGVTYPKSID